MFTAYVIVTILAAAANIYAAVVDFMRVQSIGANMTRLGVADWWFPLGALKAAGALGLLLGIAVPGIGIAAAAGIVLFFVGAIITVLRVRWYAHLPYPTAWLLLAAASLVLRLATA